MKGITSNPALDAYQRMAVSPVVGSPAVQKPQAEPETSSGTSPEVAKLSISSEARELATGGPQGRLDAEKVADVRAKMDAGQLEFDSTKIAERLVAALG